VRAFKKSAEHLLQVRVLLGAPEYLRLSYIKAVDVTIM